MSESVVTDSSKRPAAAVSSTDLPTRSRGVSGSKRNRKFETLLKLAPNIMSRTMHDFGHSSAIDDPLLNWRNVNPVDIKTQIWRPSSMARWFCCYSSRHKCNFRDLIGGSKSISF